jgi:hypothetical protein
VLADPLSHIDQAYARIEAVKSARHDQTLDDADVLGAQLKQKSRELRLEKLLRKRRVWVFCDIKVGASASANL